MKIRAGFTLAYQCPQPTQMLLVLDVHPSRRPDLLTDATIEFDPPVEARGYIDGFGNGCTRITAPAGTIQISSEFLIHDSGRPDVVGWDAVQHDIKDLPDDVLVFLLGSRYCDTDRLGDFAWANFSTRPPGWAGYRPSATSSTTTSPLTTRTPTHCAPRTAASSTGQACAATSPISRSRCAVA